MKKILLYLLLLPALAHAQIVDVSSMAAPGQVTPSITTSVSVLSTPFSTTTGTASTSQSFTTSGSNLTVSGTVTAGAGYEISFDNVTFQTSPLTITLTSGGYTNVPIYLRLAAADGVGTYNTTITVSSTGASPKTVTVTGSVTSTSPSLTVTGSFSAFSTTVGTNSASQSVTVSGANLSADASVTPPSPMVVSLDNSTFSTSVTMTHSGSTLSGQPVSLYTRIPSTASVGSISGNIVIHSTGAADQNVPITGTVNGSDDLININVSDSTASTGTTGALGLSNWNDWSIPIVAAPGQTSGFMKYSTGVVSPVQIRLNNPNFFIDNGSGYNSATTSGVPVAAFRVCMANTDSGPDTIIFTGLPAHTNGWTFKIGCSKIFTGTTRQVTFTEPVSGTTQTVTAVQSTANDVTVDFGGHVFTPASGVLKFVITDNTSFWFLNWLQADGHN